MNPPACILNTRTGLIVCERAAYAGSILQRMVGLLRHQRLAPGEGLILPSCRSIHTWFMRFSIDAIFLDRAWRVAALQPGLTPWRFSPYVWGAWAVLEVESGTITRTQVAVGDQLAVAKIVDSHSPRQV